MLPNIEPGVKICAQMSAEPSEDDLKWVKQMGVDYVVTGTDESKSSYEYYASRRKLFADHGLTVYGFGNRSVHNMDAVTLNLPNRDAKVAQYKQHLRDLGKAGGGARPLRGALQENLNDSDRDARHAAAIALETIGQ